MPHLILKSAISQFFVHIIGDTKVSIRQSNNSNRKKNNIYKFLFHGLSRALMVDHEKINFFLALKLSGVYYFSFGSLKIKKKILR